MADARAVYLVEMAGGLEGEAKSASAAVDRLGTSAAQTRMRLATMADSAEHSTRATRGFADLLDRVAPGASRALQGMADLTDGFEAVSKTIMTGGGGVVALAGGAGALAILGAASITLGAGIVAVARDVDGLADSIGDLGLRYASTAEEIRRSDALRALGTALTDAEVAAKSLFASFAEEAAPTLTPVITLIANMLEGVEKLTGAIGLWSTAMRGVAFAFTFGFSEVIRQGINILSELSEAMEGFYNRWVANSDFAKMTGLEQVARSGTGIVGAVDYEAGGVTSASGTRENMAPQIAAAKKAYSDAEKIAEAESARRRADALNWLKATNEAIEAQKQAVQSMTDVLSKAETGLGSADLEGVSAAVSESMRDVLPTMLTGAVGQIGGALAGGISGILPMIAGPIGALVAAVIEILPQINGLILGLYDEVINILTDLPNIIGELLGETLPKIMTELQPKIAGLIATLPGALTVAIVESLPELMTAFITNIPLVAAELMRAVPAMINYMLSNLPAALLEGIKQGWEAIKESFSALINPFKSGGSLGTDLMAAKGEKRLLGIKVPFFESGGMVQRTGLAVVHQGERVLNREETRQGGTAGLSVSGVTVVAPDPRSFVQRLRELQGSYGIGLNLSPLVE